MICNKQVAVKGFCYAEVHTVCLQVRTGHTKAISLLHRLHIINIVVRKALGSALKQGTQRQAIQQQAFKIFLVACKLLFCTILQTFNNQNQTILRLLRHLLQNIKI